MLDLFRASGARLEGGTRILDFGFESLCARLKGLFTVLSVTEEAYGYQTAVLLEKP